MFLVFLVWEGLFYCGFLAGLEREDIVRALVFGGFSVEFSKEVAISCIDLSGKKNKCCEEEEEGAGSNGESHDVLCSVIGRRERQCDIVDVLRSSVFLYRIKLFKFFIFL